MIHIVTWSYCAIRCDNSGWEFPANRTIGHFCPGSKAILSDIWSVLVLLSLQHGFVTLTFDKYNDENPSKIDLYENVLTHTKSKQIQIYKNWVGKAIKKIIGFSVYIHELNHPNVTMNLTAILFFINGNR